jgi:hypothetical protein
MSLQNVAGVLTGRGLMDCLQYYDNLLVFCIFLLLLHFQILTNIFYEEWNLFIDITTTATLKMKLFGAKFDVHFPEAAAIQSYTSIGGKQISSQMVRNMSNEFH